MASFRRLLVGWNAARNTEVLHLVMDRYPIRVLRNRALAPCKKLAQNQSSSCQRLLRIKTESVIATAVFRNLEAISSTAETERDAYSQEVSFKTLCNCNRTKSFRQSCVGGVPLRCMVVGGYLRRRDVGGAFLRRPVVGG